MLPLLEIRQRQLPVPRRVLDARFESVLLLFLADMQEKLENSNSILGQHPLEIVDLTIALAPDLLVNQVVHSHDEHVLIMRAVEDSDVAQVRYGFVDAPEG